MKPPKIIVIQDQTYLFVKALSFGKFLYRNMDSNYSIILSAKTLEANRKKEINLDSVKTQGPNECAIASTAMLVGMDYDAVRLCFIKHGWSPDNGADYQVQKKVFRDLGYSSMLCEKFPRVPCIVQLESLNSHIFSHQVYWNGSEIIDPQVGNEDVLNYGRDWNPEFIGAICYITAEKLSN